VAVLALVLPVSGLAASAGSTSGKDQGSGSALVPQALLDQAKANPSQLFNVVVTGQKGRSSATIANDVNSGRSDGQGKLKRQFRSINGVSASLSGADLLKLADNSHVRSIVPDQKLGLLDYQNDEMWRTSTGVSSLWSHPATVCAVNALGVQIDPLCKAVAAFVAPQAPAIAVVDSGIDPNHAADFGSRILARADMVGDGKSGDPVGHGTMVAGVAAGANSSYPGVAQNAPLLDVRVADSSGQASTSTIIAGLDWILANKSQYNIRVVNMSLGSTSAASIAFNPLDQAVEKLWLSGIVVVASAGNAGSATGPVDIGAPANDPFIITVGAIDPNATASTADDFRAPWSSYGITPDGFAKPELAAPGRFMLAPVSSGSLLPTNEPTRVVAPGYMWMSGTSFAAPVVSGSAAQVLAYHPSFTPDQVKGALLASATALPTQAGTGFGEVNAAKAVAVASPPNPNEHLNDFVTTDPTTGAPTFNSDAWHTTVQTQSNWIESNWVQSNWVQSNWVQSNWVQSNWIESNWIESNWIESNWIESNWIE
jgi:serine protease AprX